LVRISSRDHPHECGAGFSLPGQLVVDPGSPPRMWGRLEVAGGVPAQGRFTPTYVGPVTVRAGSVEVGAVHPHICRAGSVLRENLGGESGSPPRMWGRYVQRRLSQPHPRFTPTYVEPVSTGCSSRSPSTVHPHVCGAGVDVRPRSGSVTGSPPRMWGRWIVEEGEAQLSRFTPTYVGPVRPGTAPRTSAVVHPHVCGAGVSGDAGCLPSAGSPPRMWGRFGDAEARRTQVRFTPTYVGPVGSRMVGDLRPPVHPHVCGAGPAIQTW